VGQSFYFRIFLLWLLGNALRLTILAVPPVIPAIHVDLDMSATAIGVLGGLPVVMLAVDRGRRTASGSRPRSIPTGW
jgi:CP family cyanate transporter-like MFS transporter